MKLDKDPPIEMAKGEFPSLDEVMTVANCWYYLSLLERFVDTIQSMPEHILKMYLVRAEYHYCKWASTGVKLDPKTAIPPIDKRQFCLKLFSSI